MEAQLIPFAFDDNMLRGFLDDGGNPWFVAKDVCNALDLTDTNKALLGLDADEKREHEEYSGSGRKPLIVSESGLYSLVFRSRKPEARRFRKWVTAEVLPTLRRTGRYAVPGADASRESILGEMPEEARRLRPSVRANVLNCAVRVANMSGGAAEVDALFRKYCIMVGGAVSLEALPVAQRRDALAVEQEEHAYRLVREWTEELRMQAAEPYKGRKMQAAVLHRDFCAWCDARGVKPVNHRRFGQSLQRLFRKSRVCGTVHYWLNYPVRR
ncbi:BRO-N domain-containing protein [Nitratidesulfovibrio sp. 1201_IL3209]|uniref:BRO-N domain-containing protein n=1 Tax=Nitratidesulfovibrio sp. 1201_IL3209 TaxID=3084053 RepID=UPI002FDA73DD